MVDDHEHPEQQEHRTKFTTEYLTDLEIRCFRWVQISKSNFDNLPERSKILNNGYTYTGVDGEAIIKLHVDDHDCLQKYANAKYGTFKGNTSVRIRANLSSYSEKTNRYTINLHSEVSSGLKKWRESILTVIRWCRCDDICISGEGVRMGFKVVV